MIHTNDHHEVRTEKDIVRYFTVLCDKYRKKYKPLEDKRKICIVNFKGNNLELLSCTQLLEVVKHDLSSIMSLHFFGDNAPLPANNNSSDNNSFTFYMFGINIDEEKIAAKDTYSAKSNINGASMSSLCSPLKSLPVSLMQTLPY